MKRSGLPCRADADCDAVFNLTNQDSMDALRAAAEQRNAHELEAHAYTHVATSMPTATPFSQPAVTQRRRAARRKNEELNVV